MRRKRRGARPSKRAGAEPRPPSGRSRRLRLLLPAALALVAAAAWWRLADRAARPQRERPPGVADSIARLAPAAAYERGAALASRERHLESLPYLRRAAEDPGATWQVHYGYSLELHNAAFAGRQRGSIGGRAERSSFERVGEAHESLRQCLLAESLAPTPRLRAFLADERGRTLLLWGFPLDALREFQRSRAIDPTLDRARLDEQVCVDLLNSTGDASIRGYLGGPGESGDAASPRP